MAGPGPDLAVELQSGGWILGDPVRSILGTSTYLTYAGWDDLTPYVRSVSTKRGRQHELDQVDAGTATITLANRDNRFDPTNLASPYAPTVRPTVRMRVSLTWAGVRYPVFFGFVDTWPQEFTRGPEGDAWVTVRLTDGFKVLNLAPARLLRVTELTGARINATLDAAGWSPTERVVDPGVSSVLGLDSTESSALAYLQTIAASEGTLVFIGADGRFVFRDANFVPSFDPLEDVWGEGATDKLYDGITISYDDSNLWNDIRVTSTSGLAEQQAVDDYSQAQYFRRALTRATRLSSTSQMAARAASLLARYKDPGIRIERLELEPRTGTEPAWDAVLSKELHDKVRVKKNPPGGSTITQDSFIEGIAVSVAGTQTKVTWNLSPVGA